MTISAMATARAKFHKNLILNRTLSVNADGIPSNADKTQRSSVRFARRVAELLKVESVQERLAGQTSGGHFEHAVEGFLRETFPKLNMLRPGDWHFENLGGARRSGALSQFEPYSHLDELDAAVAENPTLQTVLGNAYLISPDVVISRAPVEDDLINAGATVVDETVARCTSLREVNNQRKIMHANVSCKWTLRSDRAQNARSEALNLIRNRKGRLPHVVVVTAEPTPSRLSSLALGTGDIDCVYHFALPELQISVQESGNDEASAMLENMVAGHRLKDISDLPFDLSV